MSDITPACHRGSMVQSRPLSPVVLPCLQRHFLKSMSLISDIFPSSATSSELTNLSFGSAIPLVYRPRLLLLGGEGVGLAYKQHRDLFLTLLEELPSDLPILLLATSHGELSDIEEQSVFENLSVYTVDEPSREDRSLFFDHLIEAALSVISGLNDKSGGPPKVSKAPTGLKPVDIKAKVEAEQHALRRLRTCLRDVSNR